MALPVQDPLNARCTAYASSLTRPAPESCSPDKAERRLTPEEQDKLLNTLLAEIREKFIDKGESKPDVKRKRKKRKSQATYVTNHIYGPQNNIGRVKNATFGDNYGDIGLPSFFTRRDEGFPFARRLSFHQQLEDIFAPPQPFIIFSLASLKAHLGADAAHFSRSFAMSTTLDVWRALSPEDRTAIVRQCDRSAELHEEMVGGEDMGMHEKDSDKSSKYWTFTSSMVDIWSAKWSYARGKAKKHAVTLGGTLLGMPLGR